MTLLIAAWAGAPVAAAAPDRAPRPTGTSCLERCAGRQTAAAGARVRIIGRRLDGVIEVGFRGASGRVPATPASVGRHRIVIKVPRGARTGRLRLADARGRRALAPRLRIVSPALLPAPGSFTVIGSKTWPQRAFFDDRPGVRLRYRFGSYGTRDVTVKLVRRGTVIKTWHQRGRLPYVPHRLTWNGMRDRGDAASRGRYRFKLKTPGHRARLVDEFHLADGRFPVRGPHDYGGALQRFGAPRGGGRTHQGQDVFASCGTPVVAAQGGRVQSRGFDPVLYGNWVVIDARGRRSDHRYAHFLRPASVRDRERIRTGDRIGRVGSTGNARTVGCMLHFEAWPAGWNRRIPADPLRLLRRWDGWS